MTEEKFKAEMRELASVVICFVAGAGCISLMYWLTKFIPK